MTDIVATVIFTLLAVYWFGTGLGWLWLSYHMRGMSPASAHAYENEGVWGWISAIAFAVIFIPVIIPLALWTSRPRRASLQSKDAP